MAPSLVYHGLIRALLSLAFNIKYWYDYLKSQNFFRLISSNGFFEIGKFSPTFVVQIWKTDSCDTLRCLLFKKKIVLSTHFRVLQKYWVDSWWVIAMIQSVMGVLSLDWQPTQRLCPHKITSEIHETRCSRSCCHWSCKQWKLFLNKSNMYFFSIKFVIFHIISI